MLLFTHDSTERLREEKTTPDRTEKLHGKESLRS
jgi:hypothetical protein